MGVEVDSTPFFSDNDELLISSYVCPVGIKTIFNFDNEDRTKIGLFQECEY